MPAELLFTADGHSVQGPLLITPQVFGDERGFFFESWKRWRGDSSLIFFGIFQDFQRLVLGCMDSYDSESRCILERFQNLHNHAAESQ